MVMDINSDHLGTLSLIPADLDNLVRSLHIIAYENMSPDEDRANHWYAHLEIDECRSVKIDMMGGDGDDGRTGFLVLESKKYPYTNKAVFKVTVPIRSHLTVKDFADLLFEKGRERYRFTEEIRGCAYWTLTAVTDWAEAGMIDESTIAQVKEGISHYWGPYGSEDRDFPMAIGEYY